MRVKRDVESWMVLRSLAIPRRSFFQKMVSRHLPLNNRYVQQGYTSMTSSTCTRSRRQQGAHLGGRTVVPSCKLQSAANPSDIHEFVRRLHHRTAACHQVLHPNYGLIAVSASHCSIRFLASGMRRYAAKKINDDDCDAEQEVGQNDNDDANEVNKDERGMRAIITVPPPLVTTASAVMMDDLK